MPAEAWNNFALEVPVEATLQYLFDAGRQDAAYWASKQQWAQAGEVLGALHATAIAV
jgi:hypothetical protein